MLKVALTGCGEVGTAFVRLLERNRSSIESKLGSKIVLKYVCDIRKVKPPRGSIYTSNYKDILNDVDIDVIIELIGGYEPARSIIIEALKRGKNVVTANKAVLSSYWNEVIGLAIKKKRLIYFEASVCAGVPVVQGLNEGLAGNRILEITGVLNGTTNYILTMMEKGLEYEDAVKNAIKNGFAEKDPSFDINGYDSQHKLSILSSIATGVHVKPDFIFTEGIKNITKSDIDFAIKFMNSRIKLLAHAKKIINSWYFEVRPFLIKNDNPLSGVNYEYNACILKGDFVDDVMFYGKGAGGNSAASAVVSDLIFLGRRVLSGDTELPFGSGNRKIKLADVRRLKRRFLLVFYVKDVYGVLARITTALAKNRVSINSLFQEESPGSGRVVPVRILTHLVEEFKVIRSINELKKEKFLLSLSYIPLF